MGFRLNRNGSVSGSELISDGPSLGKGSSGRSLDDIVVIKEWDD